MHATTRRRRLASGLLAAAALTACSSTNAQKGSSDGLAGAESPAAVAPAPVSVPTGANGKPLTKQQIVAAVQAGKLPASALRATAGPGSAGMGAASGSSKPETRATSAAGPVRMGPGVTATEIKIGVVLVENGATFGAALGVPTDFGNTKAQFEAVAGYLNARGGLAGRKIKPVYYTFDLGKVSTQDGQAEQEACEKWTNDDRVFAVINTALARPALLTCLGKAGIPGVHDQMPIDEATLSSYRDYYYTGGHVGGLTLDRLARTSTQVFAKRGFFGSGAVVGILHYQDPAYVKVVDQEYRPALRAAGVARVVTQTAPRFAEGNFASYAARFQSEKVTHVMFLGEAGGYPLMFMAAAENQGYRPKYGLRSDNFPANVLQNTVPAAQLKNVTAMGWMPTLDTDQQRDPGPVGPAQTLCMDIQRKAGQNMAERGPLGTALGYCNGLFFYRDALSRAGGITAPDLASAANRLGTGFASPQIYGTRYSRSQHDGVDAYRDLAYLSACSCFNYTSGVKRLS